MAEDDDRIMAVDVESEVAVPARFFACRSTRLTLRSRAKRGVSKGGRQSRCSPSFETHAYGVLLRMRLSLSLPT
jgi:hypothetical protein